MCLVLGLAFIVQVWIYFVSNCIKRVMLIHTIVADKRLLFIYRVCRIPFHDFFDPMRQSADDLFNFAIV